MAQIIGPEPDALSNDQIIKKFDGSITAVTKAATDPTYDFERIALINQARLQWLMVKGQQNNAVGYGQNDYGGQQANWIPFDWGSDQEETGADIRLCPPINFLGGDLFKFMAVMGSSSPRVKGVADDLRNPEDILSAHCADTNIRDLWVKNKIDRKWKIPAFHLYTTGPCFIRGFWNTDPVKYGQSREPKIEIIAGPDGMPIPQVVGTQAYDNGDAEISFHSVLEVSIPWEAKELRGNPLRLERMMNKWALLDKYAGKDGTPGVLDQYRDSNVPDDQMSGSSVTAAEARQAVSNPTGTAKAQLQNQWRFTEWWIPPHLFQSILSPEARGVFTRQFSRGLYIARVGNVTVEIDDRELTDEWTVVNVNRGEKIMERSVCADNVPIQRSINDLYGMAQETVLRAITQTIMDNQLIDREAMSTKEAVPAEIILTALPVDGDISKRVYQIPPARLSDQVLPLMDKARAMGQDISGVRPELSGGGQPTQTFREAKQRKDQALAQLAPQAQAMRDAAEDIARILVCLRSKYGSGTVKANRKGAYGLETDVAEMSDLQTSGWHAESDDQFPLTLSDKRDAVFGILKDGYQPEVLAALGILDPINVETLVAVLGIPDFQSAVGEQREKTLSDIDKLLQGAPIPGAPGPDGQPGPPQPSVPADPFDNHVLVAQLVSKWLVGPVGQKHTGTPGFANVSAFWAVHNQLAQPPMPPPPPPMKASLALAGKIEDFPSYLPGLLQAAGVPPADMPPPPPPPVAAGAPAPPPVGAPPPIGGPPPGVKPAMASPIPPLPPGPQPMPIQ